MDPIDLEREIQQFCRNMYRPLTKLFRILGVVLTLSCGPLWAVTVHSLDGREVVLPERFLVEPGGISFRQEAGSEIVFIPWEAVDLRRLALVHPELDRARAKAVRSGEHVYIQDLPPPNFYRAFLNQPIHVTFNAHFVYRSRPRDQLHISTAGFAEADAVDRIAAEKDGFITAESDGLKEIIDKTKYPLNTTVEGLLMVLGNDSSKHSRDLIRELQKHGAFFENLIIGLRNLEEVYPQDPEIERTRRAIASLSTGRTISVDDQRQLRRFAEHARKRS